MSNLKQFGVQLAYSDVEKLDDKLEPLQNLVDCLNWVHTPQLAAIE